MTTAALRSVLTVCLTAALAHAVGCSDSETPDENIDATLDTAPPEDQDNSGLPDGYKLWSCSTPGLVCNAHDLCAVNPICGKDLKCRPTSLMDCDDKLDCTQDSCAGPGLCKNIPKPGTCALLVLVGTSDGGLDSGVDGGADSGHGTSVPRCFKAGDKKPGDPCMSCNPTTTDGGSINATKWMPVTGGSCDDNDTCTKDDTCSSGTCKGTSYLSQCADSLACTDDLCDGKGGCLGNPIKTDWCKISGTCYKKNASHPSGTCYTCDPSTSNTSWTPITNTCMIDSKCYTQGAKSPGGCAECDPTTSTIAWTVKGTTHCLINDKCVAAGVIDTSGCSSCDPTKDKYKWSPLAGICLISGKCYAKGSKHPMGCAECDSTVSTSTWTVKGSYCFFADTCYNPGATDASGCNSCQPSISKSTFSPLSAYCIYGSKCYTPGTAHPGGCATCTTSGGTTDWVAFGTTHCMINGSCVKSGTSNTGGCATCDPSTNLYDWTPNAGYCSILGTCYAAGAVHPEGCAACQPTTSTNDWTLTDTTRCLIKHQCGNYCSGKCVYLQTDPSNCGICGKACPSTYVCKAKVCKPNCDVIASFESGTWPGSWVTKSGTTGSTAAAYAHDGALGGYNLGWHYYGGITFGNEGDRAFCWTRYSGTDGRTYLGFSAASGGAWSVVFASNTRTLIIQDNTGWGYIDEKSVVGNFVTDTWYKLEVEFLASSQIKATIYGSDDKTVVVSTTYQLSSPPLGGAAIRTMGSHQVDTISVCKK